VQLKKSYWNINVVLNQRLVQGNLNDVWWNLSWGRCRWTLTVNVNGTSTKICDPIPCVWVAWDSIAISSLATILMIYSWHRREMRAGSCLNFPAMYFQKWSSASSGFKKDASVMFFLNEKPPLKPCSCEIFCSTSEDASLVDSSVWASFPFFFQTTIW
jgi:hypothetical protein